jgi:hypothetical protein
MELENARMKAQLRIGRSWGGIARRIWRCRDGCGKVVFYGDSITDAWE